MRINIWPAVEGGFWIRVRHGVPPMWRPSRECAIRFVDLMWECALP